MTISRNDDKFHVDAHLIQTHLCKFQNIFYHFNHFGWNLRNAFRALLLKPVIET